MWARYGRTSQYLKIWTEYFSEEFDRNIVYRMYREIYRLYLI